MDFNPFIGAYKRGMFGESEVDNSPPGFHRVLVIRAGELEKIVGGVNLPDNIVAGYETAKDLIQAGQSRTQFRTNLRHTIRLMMEFYKSLKIASRIAPTATAES